MPTMPSRLPDTRSPIMKVGVQPSHSPDRARRSPSTMRRGALSISAMVRSAVSSVRTPRRVGDQDPARGGGGEVDVIDADPEIGDQPEPFGERVDDRGREPVGDRRHQDVGLGGRRDQRFGGHRLVGRVEPRLEELLETVSIACGSFRVTRTAGFGSVICPVVGSGLPRLYQPRPGMSRAGARIGYTGAGDASKSGDPHASLVDRRRPLAGRLERPRRGRRQAGRGDDVQNARFVSLRASKANVRFGPGRRYPIAWVFVRRGLPVLIVGRFQTWRRIRDWEGSEGWIHQSLLSTKRSVIVIDGPAELYRKPGAEARLMAGSSAAPWAG